MPSWKEGDHVKVVSRAVSDEDRKKSRYFEHMAGLTGIVQSVYSSSEVAIRVDPGSMSKITADVHKMANERMRQRFLNNEELKKTLTPEELDFQANYVLLVQSEDLVAA